MGRESGGAVVSARIAAALVHDSECPGDGACDSVEDEPECVEGLTHAWTRRGEGGCDQNPGVWSLGGTAYEFSAHCRYCGVRRIEITLGCQRNAGECDSVRYEYGDTDDAAVAEALRLQRRRRRQAARRTAAKVAQYGSIAAYRARLRAYRAAVLAHNLGRVQA